MKIKEIIATAGRTFNHPYESFANFRPGISIKADLEEGDDLRACLDELHLIAEADVERVKNAILEKCGAEYDAKYNSNAQPGDVPF